MRSYAAQLGGRREIHAQQDAERKDNPKSPPYTAAPIPHSQPSVFGLAVGDRARAFKAFRPECLTCTPRRSSRRSRSPSPKRHHRSIAVASKGCFHFSNTTLKFIAPASLSAIPLA